jgi:hypothetical protein
MNQEILLVNQNFDRGNVILSSNPLSLKNSNNNYLLMENPKFLVVSHIVRCLRLQSILDFILLQF